MLGRGGLHSFGCKLCFALLTAMNIGYNFKLSLSSCANKQLIKSGHVFINVNVLTCLYGCSVILPLCYQIVFALIIIIIMARAKGKTYFSGPHGTLTTERESKLQVRD